MRKPIVIAVTVAATAAAVVAAVPSQATLPGRNGRIVYQDTAGKHVQLFTVRPDGTGRRQITHFTDSDAVSAEWSPDGRRIAFERDFPDHALILTMNADGSDKRTLTPSGLQGMPAYSPDGATIVFDRTLGEEGKPSFDDALWLMDTRGGNLRRLTAKQAPGHFKIEGQPAFAPDGRSVVFSRTESDTRSATFIVNADGAGERQLSPWDLGSFQTHFSPDGSLIAFNSYPDAHPQGVSSNVFVMNADGTGLHALTHLTGGVRNAGMGSFSPDGRSIAFAKWTLKKDGPDFSVWTMRADGSRVRPLGGAPSGHVVDWGRRP
jgi:Tol biopolymer transport system component